MVNFHSYKPIVHKKTLLTVGTVLFPVAGISMMAKDSYDKDPQAFKKNIGSIHDIIKNDIGSSIKTSSKLFSGLLDKLFLPLILGGGGSCRGFNYLEKIIVYIIS